MNKRIKENKMKTETTLGLTVKRSPSKLYYNVLFLGTVVKTFKSKYDAEVYAKNH
jgi:hypothetical protein